GRAQEEQHGAGAAGEIAAPVRGAAQGATGGAAAGQRGAGGEGLAAGRAEYQGGAEESRGGSGQAGAGGEGAATCRELEVQERVPGEHVTRAAHAAQLAADPCQAPGGQPR